MSGAVVDVDGRSVRLTSLEKVWYPEARFTKAQAIDYYRRVARWMLPHLADRPLVMRRFPSGVEGGSFFERACPARRPEWVATARRPGDGAESCVANDLATLVWVANLGAIELYTLPARASSPGRPAAAAFAVEPGEGAGVPECARAALRLREILAATGLEALARTSGGRGLHVAVPLNGAAGFADAEDFARAAATAVERTLKTVATASLVPQAQRGRAVVDWRRNAPDTALLCPYSLCAGSRPLVSTPVRWDEVEEAALRGGEGAFEFTPEEVVSRLERQGDLFEAAATMRQELPL